MINCWNDKDDIPLHKALCKGHLGCAKILISYSTNIDADLNAKGYCKNTALHYAAEYGHLDMIELLVQKGANLYAENKFNSIPFHKAIRNGHTDCAKLLIKYGSNISFDNEAIYYSLYEAANYGYLDCIKLLVKHNININTPSSWSNPLHIASYRGNIECVEYLLQNDADPNRQDGYGRTALHESLVFSYIDITKLLIKYGTDPNIKDNYSRTALSVAEKCGYYDCVEFLVKCMIISKLKEVIFLCCEKEESYLNKLPSKIFYDGILHHYKHIIFEEIITENEIQKYKEKYLEIVEEIDIRNI